MYNKQQALKDADETIERLMRRLKERDKKNDERERKQTKDVQHSSVRQAV
jgi:hypothetical protein